MVLAAQPAQVLTIPRNTLLGAWALCMMEGKGGKTEPSERDGHGREREVVAVFVGREDLTAGEEMAWEIGESWTG